MLKFIHAADIHIDSPLRGLERYEGAPVEDIRGATRRAFENLVDLAVEHETAFVLLAGDLYDGDWKDYSTGLFFSRQMARLQDAGISAFVIAGNHDAASQITKVLRPPQNVHVFSTRSPETVVLESLGVAIHGQGFPTRSVTDDLSRAYPHGDPDLFNIGLLHTSLNGRPGHEPYAPCSVDGLRSRGYQYWALGHVHQREVVSEDPWIVFPGNTQGRHAREAGAKGCTLVTVGERHVYSVEHCPLDVVRWAVCPVDIGPARTLGQVYDRVGEALSVASGNAGGRPLLVRLKLQGFSPLHMRLRAAREQVVNECRALAFTEAADGIWVEKVLLETRRDPSQAEALARDDALGGLLRSIRDLVIDTERLSGLGDDLVDLSAKLPADLRSGQEPFDPTDPAVLREAMEDVRELLLDRLLQKGDAK